MQPSIIDRQDKLSKFKLLHVMSYDIPTIKEKNNSISIECDKDLEELSFDFLFNYKIFPAHILTYFAEWQQDQRVMQVGDSIVQQIYFPPTKALCKKIIVGTRIKEIIRKPYLIGFSYETLDGHIEKGISSFLISKSKNVLTFSIHTFSKANNPILNILAPLLTSPYQNYCTRLALKNMVREFQIENKL